MISRKLVLKYVLVLIQLFVVFNLKAQLIEADTIPVVEQQPAEEEEVHSPRKATLYSAVLPGLGQIYNKKYWKVPFIYIGFGTIGYFINWNNDNYALFKVGYQHLTDTNPETQDYLKIEAVRRNNYDLDNPTQFNNLKTALAKQRDYYRRNRDLLIISIVGFYGLNIIDASVDAHLFDFDISDDLTMKWEPSMSNFDNNFVYCLNFRFNF
ncbi:hypothetical protein SAMN05444274_104332 [Mariniphaga anaerophila]|uniref:DUF5683 domain-containing protein n=1 Tax=Mariniphaga anaerophila TaxID=1484053 RepID=A0A1M5AHL6_9BACT|nr:DUF5683 domain-containing protein [Mariniphaga anaerophila]SHF29758.1 hypothetical protein SAMN05444274_104332 [Mariniphaga anaerophila]